MARILVIDDQADIRSLLRDVLEEVGHEVLEASDGSGAFDRIGAAEISLVVCDIMMPVKEGIETIRELRREQPDIKIVAISGGGGAKDIDFLRMAEAFGANRILRKPFEPEAILTVVEDLLPATTTHFI